MQKVRPGSFGVEGKEPVIERISQLVRKHPSRSAAARAWGVNINTLNSYFKNLPDTPMPRVNLLQRIADSEGVTLQWLMYGETEIPESPIIGDFPASSDRLVELLSFLTNEERQQLTTMLARKGVETSIQLLLRFSTLTPSELERVIRLAEQIKEGAFEDDKANELTHPTHKQAG